MANSMGIEWRSSQPEGRPGGVEEGAKGGEMARKLVRQVRRVYSQPIDIIASSVVRQVRRVTSKLLISLRRALRRFYPPYPPIKRKRAYSASFLQGLKTMATS